MTSDQEEEQTDSFFTRPIVDYIYEIAQWANIIFIAGLVVTVFIFFQFLSSFRIMYSLLVQINVTLMEVLVFTFSLIYIFLFFLQLYNLYSFSLKAKNAIVKKNADKMIEAFRYLKSFFVILGIVVIFYVLMILLMALLPFGAGLY